MELKDKVVVITGGSKGFGKSLASFFVKEGSTVVISSHNRIELSKVAKEINAHDIYADVTKEDEVQNLAQETISKFGRIDIWINNAGITIPRDFTENFKSEKVSNVFMVNFFGTFLGCKVALSQMKSQKNGGTIINIISTSALNARPKSSVYSASKWAVNGLTKSIQLENTDSNLRILAVYPGGMKTHLFDSSKPADFDLFMDPNDAALKLIDNLKLENPETELIIKRPTQ